MDQTDDILVRKTRTQRLYEEILEKDKCICQYLKLKVFNHQEHYALTQKCKQQCNFCMYSVKDKLYVLYSDYRYNELKTIFSFDEMMSNTTLLEYISDKIDEVPFDDIIILLKHKSLKTLKETFVDKILDNIKNACKRSKLEQVNPTTV